MQEHRDTVSERYKQVVPDKFHVHFCRSYCKGDIDMMFISCFVMNIHTVVVIVMLIVSYVPLALFVLSLF